MIGRTFGELTVKNCAGRNRHGQRLWSCECSCGSKKDIVQQSLKSGATRSCGCLQKKRASKAHRTHGATGTREFSTWVKIRSRCYKKTDHAYKYYGASGIEMEEAWQDNFSNFLRDMGKIPSAKHTIERVDNLGNYCKENCIWTDDRSLQGYNRRIQRNNKSGKSGVFFRKKIGKWEASIWHSGRKIVLGFYSNKEDAILSREEAEIKYYGFNKE